MPATKLSPVFNGQTIKENGDIAAGWKIKTYLAGSSQEAATYTTAAGDIPQSNPIVLNTLGYPTLGPIWLQAGIAYKFVLTDQNDATKLTIDSITGVNDSSISVSQWITSSVAPTYINANTFTLPGDQTTDFHVNRRLQLLTTGGTKYGYITSSTYNGSLTTIVLTMDPGNALDDGLNVVNLSILRADHLATPANIIDTTALNSALQRWSIAATVAGNALILALKNPGGADPSVTAPLSIPFRDVSAADGKIASLSLTAAVSLVVSSGSTLGTANSTPFKGWLVAFNDSGTFRLGVINCLSGKDIYPLAQFGIASSTSEGGAGAADNAQVFYTDIAVTNKPYTLLGYFSYESGVAVAGNYPSSPTRVQTYSPAVPLPGATVASGRVSNGALLSGSTVIPLDDTIPQNTEGFLALSKNYAASSAAHLLDVEAQVGLSPNAANISVVGALFQGAAVNAIAANVVNSGGSNAGPDFVLNLSESVLAGTTASTAFTARVGPESSTTVTVNGRSSARLMGGVFNSFLKITERAT